MATRFGNGEGRSMTCPTAHRLGLSCLLVLCVSCRTETRFAEPWANPPNVRPESCVKYVVADPQPDERPAIIFQFPPPEDSYKGKVAKVRGELAFGAQASAARNLGFFEVNVFDITMGDPDMDVNVLNNVEFLEGKRFPVARYSVNRLHGSHRLEAGATLEEVRLEGDFELKGVSMPLVVTGTLERSSQDPAHRVLKVKWTIDKLREKFKISGPGGEDEPAGDRVDFDLQVVLKPVE